MRQQAFHDGVSSLDGETWLVTGATGYVGGRIADWAEQHGAQVIRSSRHGTAPLELPERIPRSAIDEATVVVHAAYDFRPRGLTASAAVNVVGSRALIEESARRGTRTVVLSSLSAFPGASSVYGRTKLAIEDLALDTGAAVVRPGLVWGEEPGGMYAGLVKAAALPVTPLPGGGRQIQHLVHHDDLAAVVAAAARELPSEPVSVAHPDPVSLRQIVSTERTHRRWAWTLFVPVSLAHLGLRGVEAVGFASRLRADGLVALEYPNPLLRLEPNPLGVELRHFPIQK